MTKNWPLKLLDFDDQLEVPADPAAAQAAALATFALYLRGVEHTTFVEQFVAQARRPVIIRVVGEGSAFRQALCFPVSGKASAADSITPFPDLPLQMVVELNSGHLIGLRINDQLPARFSLTPFLHEIERTLEQCAMSLPSAWKGIAQMLEGMHRKRLQFFDFVLETDPAVFWREYFPQGAARLATRALQGLSTTEAGRKAVSAALAEWQAGHYRQACDEFSHALDAARIKALCLSGLSPSLSRYNDFLNSNANSAYRIQAAEAIPLLGYLLGKDTHRAARLRHLVDDGQPLWPALADMLGVPEETVRWLRNKTADEVGDAWLGRIHALLPDLSRLPPEQRPKSREDWTAYTDFILVLNDDAVSHGEHRALWLKDLARLGWVAARQKFAAMNAAPADLLEVRDLVRTLSDALCCELMPGQTQPLLWELLLNPHGKAIAEAVQSLFYGVSILKQVRTSLYWHELLLRPIDEDEDLPEIDDAAPEQHTLNQWPAPCDGPVRLGALSAHFLVTPPQLKDEGLRMQHCVGNYDYRCLFSGSNIVSFRDVHGRSISTAELCLEDHGRQIRFSVNQHKGRDNAEAPPAACAALQRLLAQLNHEKMQPRLLEMRERLVERQALKARAEGWQHTAPNAPGRMRILKAALKLHVGYDRFLEAARKAIAE